LKKGKERRVPAFNTVLVPHIDERCKDSVPDHAVSKYTTVKARNPGKIRMEIVG
jgi:hypothetical protein